MGCSNPHPHGQIWAQGTVPLNVEREGVRQADYLAGGGRTLLEVYLAAELREQEHVVYANDGLVALVPFWALWPFETLIISRRAVARLPELTDAERNHLADVLRHVTVRYDNLFETSFPYSAGVHQAPTDGQPHPTAAAQALAEGDVTRVGELMNESHESLRSDFEVSRAELDTMVDLASRRRECFGARMTGAGFGGCAVALVARDDAQEFARTVARDYEQAAGLRPAVYVCTATGGASLERR